MTVVGQGYSRAGVPHVNRSLVVLAVAGEGGLVVIALIWQCLRGISLGLGDLWHGVLVGTVAAIAFSLVNWYLLCGAPRVWPVTEIRRFYRDSLKPVFGGVAVLDLAVISIAAGIGEELLFRGVLQPEVGVVLASGIFGVLHMGGTGAFVFGCWVAVMGAALGGLAIWTGGLLAPIVAHVLYDAVAIGYIRWVPDCSTLAVPHRADTQSHNRLDYS